MKKNNILPLKTFSPHKKTIDFLLKFSKSIAVIGNGEKKFLVSKN